MDQTCIFRDICFQDNKFTLYLDKKSLNGRFYQNYGSATNFIKTFEDLPGMSGGTSSVNIAVKWNHLPRNTYYMNTSSNYIFTQQRAILNTGHLIGDVVKPLFMEMIDMNMQHSGDFQVIVNTPCVALNKTYGADSIALCERVQQKYFSVLSHHKQSYLELPKILKEHKGKTICFDTLLLGDRSRNYMARRNDHPGAYRIMRNSFYRNNAVKTKGILPKKHQITISHKTVGYRRSILNIDELQKALNSTFPDVPVVIYKGKSLNSSEEAELLSKTTVFITPAGGSSFVSMFLPDRANAIFLDSCFPCIDGTTIEQTFFPSGNQTCCKKLESFFWSNFAHFGKKYYRPSIHEKLLIDPRGVSPDFPSIYYSYKVDIKVMISFVKQCIDDIDGR
eukprot:gene10491-3012_t